MMMTLTVLATLKNQSVIKGIKDEYIDKIKINFKLAMKMQLNVSSIVRFIIAAFVSLNVCVTLMKEAQGPLLLTWSYFNADMDE